ncbi:MAG: radical SAM family heme chaperone HemW [Candidatus Diapherotrites archaeon]|nr:radical SAM family heme chaperone HemW [Candidatus Diapherotrites archaeon]
MNAQLIESAQNKLISYNLDEVYNYGIKRKTLMTDMSSQIIVTYPPLSILPDIRSKSIFEKPNNLDFTLYFHIPFCTGKCLYCEFLTCPNQSKETVDKYLEVLKEEVRVYLKYNQVKKAKIRSVYIGGGTPTFLSKVQLGDLLDFINIAFEIKPCTEFTVESSPETLDKEKLKILLEKGVNRLNIGVQTFNDSVLRLILRRHNSKQAIESFKLARDVGFTNINIDLIRNLPDMTVEKTLTDLNIIAELMPESVSVYPLIIKPTAPIKKLYTKEPKRFPDDKTAFLTHLIIMEKLQQLGYEHNPIDWFHLNSKVYTQQIQKWEEGINALSFGVSAYSYVNNIQYCNAMNLTEYYSFIEKGKIPVCRGEKLSKEEQLNRKFVFGLKTKIDKGLIGKEVEKVSCEIKSKMDEYKRLGLIEEDEKYIKLSLKGILLAEEVCSGFYSKEVMGRLLGLNSP